LYNYPEFSEELLRIARDKEKALSGIFRQIDEISEANQYKVLNAFRKHRVSETHFNSSSGYGYNETGRRCLEAVYAEVFHAEDALVRSQITCGTHAIYLGLSANLLPGDELLYITGKPYDSLEMSIGIVPSAASLAEYGVTYDHVELVNDLYFDFDTISDKISDKTKIVAIQRSKGYRTRTSLSPEYIGRAVEFIKKIRSDIIVFVDNCYGEFTSVCEPTDYGVDLCAGSLIKNPGGGLAPTGGYLVGRRNLIERCACRLTAPGLGKEVGVSQGFLGAFFQGLSLAPPVVANALKNAHFLAAMTEHFGYKTCPAASEPRSCIVQAVDLNTPEKVVAFCTAIQHASYVDSYVSCEGADMPGYTDKVIMASGAFVSGSSIELSADAPIREPYTVFYQGGLTYEHGKYAILSALTAILQ
jgi:cystathionine beta-lyase family protein involved in aluminum resistance